MHLCLGKDYDLFQSSTVQWGGCAEATWFDLEKIIHLLEAEDPSLYPEQL